MEHSLIGYSLHSLRNGTWSLMGRCTRHPGYPCHSLRRCTSCSDLLSSCLPVSPIIRLGILIWQVDMATHGQSSWALTNLNGWRSSSLSTENSAGFLREKQREARRALLRGGAESIGDRRQEEGVANVVTDAGHRSRKHG